MGLLMLWVGTWVPIHSDPYELLINLGDLLDVTNGQYKSAEHQAVTNGDGDRDPWSVVPPYVLGPLSLFVTYMDLCRYHRFNQDEYSNHYVNSKLQWKKT